jgi:hypothetical protein
MTGGLPPISSCWRQVPWDAHLAIFFQLALARAVILRSESRGTHNHILLSRVRDSPNLEGKVPVFISPRNRVTQLYPQALGSHFVAFYDSQGYGGGIRPCLHTGCNRAAFNMHVLKCQNLVSMYDGCSRGWSRQRSGTLLTARALSWNYF